MVSCGFVCNFVLKSYRSVRGIAKEEEDEEAKTPILAGPITEKIAVGA